MQKSKRPVQIRPAGNAKKHAAFAHEFLVDLNGTQAAIRAGYSARSAYSTANRLLRNDEVKTLIASGQAEAAERAKIKIDDVVAELAKVAFANLGDFLRLTPDGKMRIDLAKPSRDQLAAVSVFEITDDIAGREDGRECHNSGEERIASRRRTRLELHNKVQALFVLGMHLGFWRSVQGARVLPSTRRASGSAR